MNNKDFVSKLKNLSACSETIEWIGDRDLKTAWNECEHADWMLWLACKMEIGSRQERIHAICDCAETALTYVPKGEDRPRLAIEATRRYADNPTEENRAARAAAWATAVGDAAWAAAWAAAEAAAGDAARAAAWAAAGDAAEAAAHKKMCVMIREKIKP